ITWDNVITAAESCPELRVAAAPAPIEVAGTVIDQREILFDSLNAANPEVQKNAMASLIELGTQVDDLIEVRFPGLVSINPFADHLEMKPFRECSSILAYLAARGDSAAPLVMSFLESPEPLKRFFAIYFFYEHHYPPVLEYLARRLYDTEHRNRYLAADTLRCYQKEEPYKRILDSLREHLKVPLAESQIATIQILGQLREPSAVPSLIPLVVSKEPQVVQAASSALTVICGQSFGPDVSDWAEWWRQNYNKHRETWLKDALQHSNAGVAQLANAELEVLKRQMARSIR
ncbi:hypothetical protein KAI87_16475, partial [Myxococcota bacterium]|nr:hypothetical protein [Myxococcota bacterium]